MHRFHGTLRYPDTKDAYFTRDRWGDITSLDGLPGAPHCGFDIIPSPDGLLFVVSCSACGGRAEYLFNSAIPMSPETQAEFLAHADQQVRSAMTWMMESWLPQHRQCDRTPLTHPVDPNVEGAVEGLRARLTEMLAKGEEAGGFVGLIFTSNMMFGLSVADLPPATTPQLTAERYAEATARIAMLRDFAAQQPWPVRAAVLVSEVWVSARAAQAPDDASHAERTPSLDPERKEALVVAYLTPTMGRQALFPIIRTNGTIGEGPAVLGEPEWMPYQGGLILTGLMAQPWDRAKPPRDNFLM